MDFFLAYHHEDKGLAGKVKQELERRGSTAFLAHEDIEVSKTWREEILSHLRACQALIAVITHNFGQSAYANQEAGFVLGKGKPVISLNFTKDLPGFLESIQAIHSSEATVGVAVEKAIKVIQGREPSAYIEPAFKPSLEIEEWAIKEVIRHVHRTEPSVKLEESNVYVSKIMLKETMGIYELAGSVTYYDYWNERWTWEIVVDARTGRVLSKTVLKVPREA